MLAEAVIEAISTAAVLMFETLCSEVSASLPHVNMPGEMRKSTRQEYGTPMHTAGDRVIEVNVSTDPKKTRDISDDTAQIVDFTYSVKWEETQIPPEKRMEKYSKYSFLPQHLEVRGFLSGAERR